MLNYLYIIYLSNHLSSIYIPFFLYNKFALTSLIQYHRLIPDFCLSIFMMFFSNNEKRKIFHFSLFSSCSCSLVTVTATHPPVLWVTS